jgi:methionyl-tRNA synthetase
VNAEPHIGFALEIVQADVYVRFRRSLGDRVFFNTGTDEHGQKIFDAAEKAGKPVQEYVDYYANEFKKLKGALGLSDDLHFIRTTDANHVKAAEEMWKRCYAKGDIEKKAFKGLYCVGCEKFLTQREIIDGKCHIHGTAPELLKEENYFFKLSKYKDKLLKYLSTGGVVIPDWRREEAIGFVKELEDVSISREKARLSWGVPVPGDDSQVMYVWFEALVSYISTLGWPNEEGDFKKFWKEGHTLQMAGKDQVRFQSIMWQAMLISADIKYTDQVFYHGFINSDGQKMSKSLGNVISPYDLVKKYGTEATRYLLLRHVHATEDTDVTWEKLDEWYTADLVSGLGNWVARVMQMASQYLDGPVDLSDRRAPYSVAQWMNKFEFHNAIGALWIDAAHIDEIVQEQKPFEVVKTNKKQAQLQLTYLVKELSRLSETLEVFMPNAAQKINEAIRENKKPENLFARIDA